MGHALNNSVQDCLIRYHRMTGQRTKWILGTDHAGIATQTQVERALVEEGTSREELGREAFVERVWDWREQYGGAIIEQLKRLGASCDYERGALHARRRATCRPSCACSSPCTRRATSTATATWSTGIRGAARRSRDLEVEDREVTDTLYYIDYPLASGSGAITVATVRPETMLADTAIAVHPDDERYQRLIGETAILPLVGRKLKIIADEYVKPEFGTGALKITPGTIPTTSRSARRHGLAEISVIGEDGRITDDAPERFVGHDGAEAREAVVAELRDGGLIARTEDLHAHGPVLAPLRASGSSRSSRCSGSCAWTSSPRPRSTS